MVSSRIFIRVLQLQAGHKTQSALPNGISPSYYYVITGKIPKVIYNSQNSFFAGTAESILRYTPANCAGNGLSRHLVRYCPGRIVLIQLIRHKINTSIYFKTTYRIYLICGFPRPDSTIYSIGYPFICQGRVKFIKPPTSVRLYHSN